VLGLRTQNCSTGEIIDDQQVQAANKEDVLNVLTQIAASFRTRVDESLATVKKLEIPLVEATTPSLKALKQYSAAWKVGLSPDPSAAVPLLQRALEIDPQFAMAHAFLGRLYGDTGETAKRPRASPEPTSCGIVPATGSGFLLRYPTISR
jgi:eukaryotic-like serine/threonine-protein kinase